VPHGRGSSINSSISISGALSSTLRTIAWSPLGNYVATGAGDRRLRVWNPERAYVKHSTELRGHAGTVDRVAWNPVREAELASCGSDGSVRVWDVRSKGNVAEWKTGKECFSLCWKPDGAEIVVGTKDDWLISFSRLAGSEIARHKQLVQTNQVIFSWSGAELFLTGGDGTVKIFDYPSMELLHSLKANSSSCYSLELSSDGRYLAVGGTDALVTLWDTWDWYCKRSLGKMTGPIRTVSFSWDSGYLVAGSEDDVSLEIAHVDTGDYIHAIETGAPAPLVQWSPRDYSLAYSVTKDAGGLRIINGSSLI